MSGRGRLLRNAANFRGGILNGVILLERIIDSYLSWYFTNDKLRGDELMDMLFASKDGVPMKRKTILFKKLIKKNDINFHNSNDKFFKDIDFVIEQRNIFAHYLLDTDDQAIKDHIEKKSITFLMYHDEEKKVHYDIDKLDDIVDKIEYTLKIASNVYKDLRNN